MYKTGDILRFKHKEFVGCRSHRGAAPDCRKFKTFCVSYIAESSAENGYAVQFRELPGWFYYTVDFELNSTPFQQALSKIADEI